MRKAVAVLGVGVASAGLIGSGLMSPAHAATTLRFNDVTIQSRNLTPNIFVAAGVDRSNGKVIGYSTLRGRIDGDEIAVNGAVALRGGLIYFRLLIRDGDDTSDGRVTGGTGTYEDATGSLTAREVNDTTSAIRLTYNT